MKTGLNNSDKVFNIEQAQLILLTGTPLVDMLSGDISNNICLNFVNTYADRDEICS